MSTYFETIKPLLKEYFAILSDEIPDFILPYIQTPEMKRLGKISNYCGTDYTKLFHHKIFYSSLDHSIATALIIWNFTKDKKQTLAGLFHDIASPVYRHCIDFMNEDYEKQESTEELTMQKIQGSKEIMDLLEKDGILLKEVEDYHQYPIADNDTPKLSTDRLEYTLISAIVFDQEEVLSLEEVKIIYEDIVVLKNEDGILELGFKHLEIAEGFIRKTERVWEFWIENRDKITMQFIADVVKRVFELGEITKQDLYTLTEEEVIEKIEHSKDPKVIECFQKFRELKSIGESDVPMVDRYCICLKVKKRYMIPLVQTKEGSKRINEVSQIAQKAIDKYLNFKQKEYSYFEFEF